MSDWNLLASLPHFSSTLGLVWINNPPTISGTPDTSTMVGEPYSFTPVASDADGDQLFFEIDNMPLWASFDADSGTVSGVPDAADAGTYPDIGISVNDGNASASLPLFSVAVNQTALGSATLSWTPPTQNTDGTALTDLVAYKFYFGVSQGVYPNQVRVDSPGISTYVIVNLTPNVYYFVATAINAAGMESDFSNMATMTVNSP